MGVRTGGEAGKPTNEVRRFPSSTQAMSELFEIEFILVSKSERIASAEGRAVKTKPRLKTSRVFTDGEAGIRTQEGSVTPLTV